METKKLTIALKASSSSNNNNKEFEPHENENENENASSAEKYTTVLPPRKRARTKEEKEQRRIERILRNRRAAHLSREKKKKYIEFLENSVIELVKKLGIYKKFNQELAEHAGLKADLRARFEQFSEEIAEDEKRYQDVLEKINQNKNLNIVLNGANGANANANSNTGANGSMDLTSSNPATPVTPVFVFQNNANGNGALSPYPATPKNEITAESFDTANSLTKLAEAPIQSHASIATSLHTITKNVNGLGINLPDSGKLDSAPTITGLQSGELGEMGELAGEDSEENDAVMIMMSLKNGNGSKH